MIKWFIEKHMFSEYEEKLISIIRDKGMSVVLYEDTEPNNVIVKSNLLEDDIVIFHCSLQDGSKVLRTPVYPGVWLTKENYECYKWMGYYGDNLLNSEYLMMGLNDVIRNKHKLKDFGTDKIFIRPSDGLKTFPGQVITLNNLEEDISVLSKCYGGISMETLIIVAPDKSSLMKDECRFVVVNGEVITGARYMDAQRRKDWTAIWDNTCSDLGATVFAQNMTNLYQPDTAFTLDVCRLSNGEYKVIEINSFNCASLYGSDLEKVVTSVSKAAIKEHQDIWGDYKK